MIEVLTGLPEGVLGFRPSGKLTARDYTDVLAPALDAAGVRTWRTDTSGDVVVVVREGEVGVVARD